MQKTAATTSSSSSRAKMQATQAQCQRVAYRISFIAYRHNSHSTPKKVQGIPRMRKHSGVPTHCLRQKCHTHEQHAACSMQRHRCREPFEMHLSIGS